MNMEIIDTKKAYKTPRVKIVEVNIQGILCLSDGDNSEGGIDNYERESFEL